ncbi:hypothetical protein N337_00741, partial [Phoenicopterus ruber ruber]
TTQQQGDPFPQGFVSWGGGVGASILTFPPPHEDICGLQGLTRGVQLSCHFGMCP